MLLNVLLHGVIMTKQSQNSLQWNEMVKKIYIYYCTGFHKLWQWAEWNEMNFNFLFFLIVQVFTNYGSAPSFFICLSSLLQNSSTSLKTDKMINTGIEEPSMYSKFLLLSSYLWSTAGPARKTCSASSHEMAFKAEMPYMMA